MPKTSSGKIRRSAAKQLYESGRLESMQRALWFQVLRLALAGLAPQSARFLKLFGELLYAVWWWTILAMGFFLGWLAVMILPRLSWRWAALRHIARGILWTMGIPVTITGINRIPPHNAVLAFNHSSYMDALVLTAVLPGEPGFVAKMELAKQVFAGPFLRRLATPFVQRYDVVASLEDAAYLVSLARQGRNLVFFPEGTFTRRPGLSGFFLGSFKVAAEANLPVVPCVIRGTRSMLRGDQWFPRRAAISIEIADAIRPSGTDFASLVRLRDAVRDVMLARCGEPDLGELMRPEQL